VAGSNREGPTGDNRSERECDARRRAGRGPGSAKCTPSIDFDATASTCVRSNLAATSVERGTEAATRGFDATSSGRGIQARYFKRTYAPRTVRLTSPTTTHASPDRPSWSWRASTPVHGSIVGRRTSSHSAASVRSDHLTWHDDRCADPPWTPALHSSSSSEIA